MSESPKYGSLPTEEKPLEGGFDQEAEQEEKDDTKKDLMTHISISAILSTAFTYGCIMTTLFILTLPIECQRIEVESTQYHAYTIRKSMALGGFATIAGMTQLITPLLGMMSDHYVPYGRFKGWGRRMPYLIVGTIFVVTGMIGQFYASNPIHRLQVSSSTTVTPLSVDDHHHDQFIAPKTAILGGAWGEYTLYFTLSMIGLNIVYTVMIALIPDLVPTSQTGVANGALALMVVCGSLFGFGMFHFVLDEQILDMYKMYGFLSFVTGCVTFVAVCDREAYLQEKKEIIQSNGVASATINDNEEQQDDNSISIHDVSTLIVNLFYEPIKNKTQSELFAAYWIDFTEHHDFFIVTISRFFYYMAISSQTFFLYYIHDALRQSTDTSDPEASVALLAIVGQTAGAITCFPVGIISDQYFGSRRKPFVFLACFCLGVGNLALLVCTTLRQMVWVCTLLGAANGIYLTMDTSLAVDTLDLYVHVHVGADADADVPKRGDDANACSDEETTVRDNIKEQQLHPSSSHHDGAAQLLGVWGVFGFIGSAMGPLIGGITLLILGKRDVEPTQFYSMKGYEGLFSLSAFYFLCSSASLAFVRKKGV